LNGAGHGQDSVGEFAALEQVAETRINIATKRCSMNL
jgi:hypothetical protein